MGEKSSEAPTSETSLNHITEDIYYSFTIKYIKKGIKATIPFLEQIMYSMLARYKAEYCTHSVELDSKERNHIHGVMIARKGLRYTNFKYPYTHIYIRRIESYADLVNWCDYIEKDEVQSLIDYFTNGENHFVNTPPVKTDVENSKE